VRPGRGGRNFNATGIPSAAWLIQQLREVFACHTVRNYPIFDRDAIFSTEVIIFVEAIGIESCRTAYRSPRQNGVAGRWIVSCPWRLFDYVIVIDRHHLIRFMRC
jgi:hypothetical protein